MGNISWDTSDQDLKDHFNKYGKVTDAHVALERETHRSRGFAFVTFEAKSDAENVRKECNDSELRGRRIRIELARPRDNPSSFGDRGGGGGRGGDGPRRGGGGDRRRDDRGRDDRRDDRGGGREDRYSSSSRDRRGGGGDRDFRDEGYSRRDRH